MENFKELLEKCIKETENGFTQNELAFLALQGKIELQLRDKIAWLLYDKEGYHNVKKEYAPKVGDIGRKKCDLAILDDDLNPKLVTLNCVCHLPLELVNKKSRLASFMKGDKK